MRSFQASEPVSDQPAYGGGIQTLVFIRIFFEIRQRELEQRGGGTQAVLLQMHKRPGQLNQPFVKRSVGSGFVLEPQIFQHFVRFVKKLPVEAIEIAGVMRVEFLSAEGLDPGGDAGALVTHMKRVKSKARSPKSKVTVAADVSRL